MKVFEIYYMYNIFIFYPMKLFVFNYIYYNLIIYQNHSMYITQ